MNDQTWTVLLLTIVIVWLSTLAVFTTLFILHSRMIERLWKWESPHDDDDDDDDDDDADWWKQPEDPPRPGKAREFTLAE